MAPASEQSKDKAESPAEETAEETESEYEIEKILDVEKLKDGTKRYKVRWVGYGPEHDSYVDEDDAENAKDLIDKYWKEHDEAEGLKKKKRGRQSSASASATKGRRKSEVVEDEDEDEVEKPAPKKARGASAKEPSAKPTRTKASPSPNKDVPMDEDMPVGDMKRYLTKSSWNDLVDEVTTVEFDQESQQLYVYFSLKTGHRVREVASTCRTKMPDHLIEFYEAHLKWTDVQAGDK